MKLRFQSRYGHSMDQTAYPLRDRRILSRLRRSEVRRSTRFSCRPGIAKRSALPDQVIMRERGFRLGLIGQMCAFSSGFGGQSANPASAIHRIDD